MSSIDTGSLKGAWPLPLKVTGHRPECQREKVTHPDGFSHCLISSNLAEIVRFLAGLKKTCYMNNSTAGLPLGQSHVIDKPVHSHNLPMRRQMPREGKEPARSLQLIAGTAVTRTQVLLFRAQGSPLYSRYFLPTIPAAGLEHVFVISCNRHNE